MTGKKYSAVLGVIGVIVLLVALLISGCAGQEPSAKEPIKVGIIMGLTGSHAAFGVPTHAAAKAFFETEGKEIAGRSVVIVEEDDESRGKN